MQEIGFSILLVKKLSNINEASPAAVAVQLVLCARHQCIATVCRMLSLPQGARHGLSHEVNKSVRNLHYQGTLYPHFMVIYEQRTAEQEANL
jgi:hypothetical protein